MNVFLFAVADPDLDLPSSSTTYVREKVSFPSGTNLTDVFIILSSTTFSHFPHLLSRGLNLVIFYGKLVDSDQNMSVSISDLTEHWDILLRDFSKIFHITFRIHRSQTNIPRQEVTKSPAFSTYFHPLLIELPFAKHERATKKENFHLCLVVNGVPSINR